MEVVVADGVEQIGRLVADLIETIDPLVMGVATGSSPLSTYRELVGRGIYRDALHLFLLDEYVGLPPIHRGRYQSVMLRQFATPLGLANAQVHAPGVDATDLDAAAQSYEQELLASGGVDVQILGLGRNGHIGFNEPGTSFDSMTHVGTLTEATRSDNAASSTVATRCRGA